MRTIVTKTDFSDLKLLSRGKVRDMYDLGDEVLRTQELLHPHAAQALHQHGESPFGDAGHADDAGDAADDREISRLGVLGLFVDLDQEANEVVVRLRALNNLQQGARGNHDGQHQIGKDDRLLQRKDEEIAGQVFFHRDDLLLFVALRGNVFGHGLFGSGGRFCGQALTDSIAGR